MRSWYLTTRKRKWTYLARRAPQTLTRITRFYKQGSSFTSSNITSTSSLIKKRKTRDALNRPALPPGMVIVPPLPAETEVNIAPPLIRNQRGRFRVERAQQRLRNKPDRELENPRPNESFQVPRGRIQGNRTKGHYKKSQAGIWALWNNTKSICFWGGVKEPSW